MVFFFSFFPKSNRMVARLNLSATGMTLLGLGYIMDMLEANRNIKDLVLVIHVVLLVKLYVHIYTQMHSKELK